MDQKSFENTLEKARAEWLTIDGVKAVKQGKKDDRICLLVLVSVKNEDIKEQIPEVYDGIPVEIRDSDMYQTEG